MYSPPSDLEDQRRIRAAFAKALHTLGATWEGPGVWGWRGRTLSGRVHHPQHGTCWLRLLNGPRDQAGGKIWEGNREAAALFEGRINKPVLYDVLTDNDDHYAYQAELSQYINEPTCSPDPVLRTDPDLPATWWDSLKHDLTQVHSMPTSRVAVRQEWVDRSVPQFLNLPAPQITDWATAHGDLHTANLTTGTPYLMDWEGFGQAPAGYDAAMLLAYSLLVPEFARQVRRTFAILSSENGRTAQIIVVTELMQSASRGDHPELLPELRALSAELASS